MTAKYRIERLTKQDRGAFDCGIEPLNRYLKRQASQDERRRVSACYLLIAQATEEVAGYYTLSAGGVLLSDLPDDKAKKLPRYPTVPIARVGRLAVSTQHQGQGVGGVLLLDAIRRSSRVEMGVYAVVVDAKDDHAAAFYEHHGFLPREQNKRTLFLAISEAIKKLLP